MNARNTLKIGALVAAMGMVVSSGAMAADNVDQTIGYEVTAINEIAISGNIAAMTINAATAGAQPDPVTDATTSYSITTNGTDMKITAELDTAMPDHVTLSLTATAPSVGTSAGEKALTATAQDVVTDITEVAESGIGLSYELAATVSAGIVAAASKTVTLTIADGS